MARRSLADLVNQRAAVTETDEPERGVPEKEAHEATSTETDSEVEGEVRKQPEPATTGGPTEAGADWPIPHQSPAASRPVSRPGPKYLRLQRKEARLREDQLMRLTALSRRVSREKRGKEERITENTLLRVAVDLLLEREDNIRGDTEEEIRAALGLEPGA